MSKRFRLWPGWWWFPGLLAILVIVSLTGWPLYRLINFGSGMDVTALLASKYVRHVTWFSFWQATLSTVLSLGLAIPVAFALARQSHFFGRSLLLRAFSISLIFPTIVAVFGIVAVYGNRGWINQGLAWAGLDTFSLYGLPGILLAHVFFNLPLCTRVILQSLENIPSESWRLSQQLGMSATASFRWLQWPAILRTLPGLALLVFGLCFTSFTIVLTLGGGPASSTIEVAIYQAMRLDFDIEQATALAILQLVICLILFVLASLATPSTLRNSSRGRVWQRSDGDTLLCKSLDFSIILSCCSLILLPFLAVILAGFSTTTVTVLQQHSFWLATMHTLMVALPAGLLSAMLAYALLLTSSHLQFWVGARKTGHMLELFSALILVFPPLVLGVGLFLVLRPLFDVFALAWPLTLLINSLMGLPFSVRILRDRVLQHNFNYQVICQSLQISGWHKFSLIDWPVLRKPLALAIAVSASLAAGDLTAISLFGSSQFRTIPLLLYQRMSSYRLEEAAATALLLLLLCLLLFWLLERIIGGASVVGKSHCPPRDTSCSN